MSAINSSPVSKPFVVSAIVLLFIGSSIGAIWNMSLYGIIIPEQFSYVIPLHKIIQLDGFLSLLIMGIGYMIVPRFRNTALQFPKVAYASYGVVITSVSISFAEFFLQISTGFVSESLRIIGILIFVILIFSNLREKPKLLPHADYFVIFSVMIFLSVNILKFTGIFPHSILSEIHLWLLFPIMMVFGVQYKTLPSLLGFIRPKKRTSDFVVVLSASTCVLGILTVLYSELELLFNIMLLGTSMLMSFALFIFGGFDNTEIKNLFSGEKKIRYQFAEKITKIAYIFLIAGLGISVLHEFDSSVFAFYDLGIHFVTIGFIGFTILLYLPIMLPPIINKTIHFIKFNKIPIHLVIAALAMRTIGDFLIIEHAEMRGNEMLNYVFGFSGWLVVAGLFAFVIMLHRSMDSFKSKLKVM